MGLMITFSRKPFLILYSKIQTHAFAMFSRVNWREASCFLTYALSAYSIGLSPLYTVGSQCLV